MRVFLAIGLCALMLPALACAAEPIDAAVLGQIEAKRDFCDHVDPSGAKDRGGFFSALIGQFSADDLQSKRDSEPYKSAYSQTSAQLGTLDTQSAASACSVGAR